MKVSNWLPFSGKRDRKVTQVPSRWVLGPKRLTAPLASAGSLLEADGSVRPWSFQTSSGRHEGLLWRAGHDRPFLLHFYGARMSLDREIGRLSWLHRTFRLNVACVDYLGYGRSASSWAPEHWVPDALLTFDHLQRLAGSQPIHLHGFSMGASVAAQVAAQRQAASLILLAPPASFADCQRQYLKRWPLVRWVNKVRPLEVDPVVPLVMAGLDAVRDTETPLMVLHGDQDKTIPIEQGERVYWSSAATTRRFVKIKGVGHCRIPYNGGIYEESLGEWFQMLDRARVSNSKTEDTYTGQGYFVTDREKAASGLGILTTAAA